MADIEATRQAFVDAYVNNVGKVACASLYFWDWLLTFADEVELIWRQPSWKGRGFLFIAVRYITVVPICFNLYAFTIVNESEQVRNIVTTARVVLMMLIVVLVQVILQLRVYIMYNRSRALLRGNAALFLAEIAVTVGIYFALSPRIKYLPASPDCGYCSIFPNLLGFCYVSPLLFEAYLAWLMIRKSRQNRKLFRGVEAGGIFYILVRDSILYFALVFSSMLASMMLFFIAPQKAPWTDVCVYAATTAHSSQPTSSRLLDTVGAIGGTRLILSMRKAVAHPTETSHVTGGIELSDLSNDTAPTATTTFG